MASSKTSPMIQTTIVQFVILGFGLINSLLLARLLGPGGRGEWAAVLLWPQALVYLGSFGIQDACAYYAARPQARSSVVMTNAFVLFLVQTAIILPLGFVMLPFLLAGQTVEVVEISRYLLATTALGLIALYGASVLRGKLDMSVYNLLSLIVPIGSVLGTLFLILMQGLVITNLARVYVTLCVALAVATLVALFARRLWSSFQIDGQIIKLMLGYGSRVQIGSISQMANLRLDQMLMAAFLPPAQLGLYVVAVSVASIANVLPYAIKTVLTPRIAQSEGSPQDVSILQNQLRMYWSASVVSGMLLLVAAPFVILLLFGAEYRASILATEILVIGVVCLGGKNILSGASFGLGTPTLVSQAEIFSLVITAVALVLLLPPWGFTGAALASLLAYATSLVFLAFRLRQVHRISPRAVLVLHWRDFVILLEYAWQLFGTLYRRINHLADDYTSA